MPWLCNEAKNVDVRVKIQMTEQTTLLLPPKPLPKPHSNHKQTRPQHDDDEQHKDNHHRCAGLGL